MKVQGACDPCQRPRGVTVCELFSVQSHKSHGGGGISRALAGRRRASAFEARRWGSADDESFGNVDPERVPSDATECNATHSLLKPLLFMSAGPELSCDGARPFGGEGEGGSSSSCDMV